MAARYNVQEVLEFFELNHTDSQIADYYNVTRQSFSAWVKRYERKHTVVLRNLKPKRSNRRKLNLKRKPKRLLGHQQLKPTGINIFSSITAPINQLNLSRLPKYGNLEVTNYISHLNNDDWIVEYCGEGYDWVDMPYLTEMREKLWLLMLILILLPRGHGKTMSCIGLFVRSILEQRIPILTVTAGPNMSKKIFNEIKRLLKTPKIRLDYGDSIESFDGSTKEIWLLPELRGGFIDPVLKALGRGGDIIGSHPRWLHLEDIIQTEFQSHESNEALIHWLDAVITYCAVHQATNPTRITATGTRKSLTDLYSYMLYKKNFRKMHKQALIIVDGRWPTYSDCKILTVIDEYGLAEDVIEDVAITGTFTTLNCPNWPLRPLLYERIKELDTFEAEMNNNPLPSTGLYFEKDQWIVIDHPGEGHFTDFYISVDPSYGATKSADNTAILILTIYGGKLVIVDGIMDKLDFDEIGLHLKKYTDEYKPLSTWLETDFAQIWLKQDANRRGLTINPVDRKGNKNKRIDAIKIHFVERRIQILKECPIINKLYVEYLQYNRTPSTATRKDDGLDALQQALEKLSHYLVQTNIKSLKLFYG